MSVVSFSTFISLRLFANSATPSISPETQQALIEAMSDDLAQMLHPLGGTLVTEKSEPLAFEFTDKGKEGRRDLLRALECSITLLHRLASFRLGRAPEEQPAWSFRMGIVTISTDEASQPQAREKAAEFAHDLSQFAQTDQIVLDDHSFQELHLYPVPGWKWIESESDYGQNSQVLYERLTPEQKLPEDLVRKCFQLSALHLSPDDSFCFYYIGLSPQKEIPVLRLYTAKALPAAPAQQKSAPSSEEPVVIGRYTLVSVLGVGEWGKFGAQKILLEIQPPSK